MVRPPLPFLPLLLLALLLPGCVPRNPQALLEEMTPAQHFEAGEALAAYPEDLPLAIWHFSQCRLKAQPGSPLATSAALEQEKCTQAFLLQREAGERLSSQQQSQEEQLRLLRRRNAELEGWVSRLNTENLALRQSLLKAQERALPPQ